MCAAGEIRTSAGQQLGVEEGAMSDVSLEMCSKFRLLFPDFKFRFSLPDLPCHVEINQQNYGSSAPGALVTSLISNLV